MQAPPPKPESADTSTEDVGDPAQDWRPPTLEDVMRRARRLGLLTVDSPNKRNER